MSISFLPSTKHLFSQLNEDKSRALQEAARAVRSLPNKAMPAYGNNYIITITQSKIQLLLA